MTCVKILCPCGQKFVFEVEPVDGRMPGPMHCPDCGRDLTEAADNQIANNTPVAPPTAGGSSFPAASVLAVYAAALVLFCVLGGVVFLYQKTIAPPKKDPKIERAATKKAKPRPAAPKVIVGSIGLSLAKDAKSHNYVVKSAAPNSPAAKAEVPLGLVLTKIEGRSVQTNTLTQVNNLLRGPVGSKVELEFLDPDTELPAQFKLTREKF